MENNKPKNQGPHKKNTFQKYMFIHTASTPNAMEIEQKEIRNGNISVAVTAYWDSKVKRDLGDNL